MTEPAQKPGKSRQDFGTPRAFLDAVELRFGPITIDLAAHEGNHVVSRWFGPDGEAPDSLVAEWPSEGLLWLNPEFADIEPWAAKCAAYRGDGRILSLTPASIGANWFARHVNRKAFVFGIQGRLSFDGKSPYPKDCMLSVFGNLSDIFADRRDATFDVWDWRNEKSRVRT